MDGCVSRRRGISVGVSESFDFVSLYTVRISSTSRDQSSSSECAGESGVESIGSSFSFDVDGCARWVGFLMIRLGLSDG